MTILPLDGFSPVEADWLGGMPGVVKDHSGVLKVVSKYRTSSFSIFGNSSADDNYSTMQTGVGGTAPSAVLLVGSNNAAETYNDYCLDILDDLTAVGYRSAGITYTSEGCIYTTVKSFTNNTENDITVNEMGLSQRYSAIDVLLYRKKLDNPVTLKANGGTATFSLVINIPYANKP